MTGHQLEYIVGLWLLLAAAGFGGVYGLVAWGTRHERLTEPRLPRCVVQASDWLDSYTWADEEPVTEVWWA